MRERPPLPDSALVAALAAGWGVAAASVEFLPVGDDSNAWSFRVVAGDGGRWFLKVRRGPVDPATVLVPGFLRDHGLEQVVAAVPAAVGDPWRPLGGGFTLLVYPWVDGVPAMELGLTDRQWADLGGFVAGLHRSVLPAELAATVARESFAPWGARPVRELADRIGRDRPGDPLRRELAELWRAHRDEIGARGRPGRAAGPGRGRRPAPAGPVPQRHPPRQPAGRPRRPPGGGRLGRPAARAPGTGPHVRRRPASGRGSSRGTGPPSWTGGSMAYYRWEWVVQELADYGGRVLDDRLGEATRRPAVEEFRRLFAPGGLVEAARRADQGLAVS